MLPDSHDVHVVVDQGKHPEPFGQSLSDGIEVPAGHDGRRYRPTGGELHRTRQTDADAAQPVRILPGFREEGVERALQPRKDPFGTLRDRDLLRPLGEDPPRQIGDGHPGVHGADVSREDHPGVAVERQRARWTATRRRAVTARHEQPVGHERVDPLRDGRAG
jgi:hypothetical protein